jgi:ABC-type amino acid transport substrate-binding protein
MPATKTCGITASSQIRRLSHSKGDRDAPDGYTLSMSAQGWSRRSATECGDVKATYVETNGRPMRIAAVASDRNRPLVRRHERVTLRRRETVDFSQPIFLTGASARLRTDSPGDLLGPVPRRTHDQSAALAGTGVPFCDQHLTVSRAATTTEADLRSERCGGGIWCRKSSGFADARGGTRRQLERYRIDAYVGDSGLVIGQLGAGTQPGPRLIDGSRLLTAQPYGIVDEAWRLPICGF